ncbi:MAG: beta-hexosaminidase, partial [Clostridia bacterium]|nr:beta-hexosaminidase [Clostridia bacterium]
MDRSRIISLAALFLALCLLAPAFAGCAAEPASTVTAPLSAGTTEENKASEILASMTVEEKIAQMLMPAFRYYTDGEGKKVGVEEISPEIRAKLEKYGFAGTIFFAQNIVDSQKTAVLIDAMQRANAAKAGRPQLLCAVDQEGGVVARIGRGTRMPGNMALGAAGQEETVRKVAGVIAEELTALGLNYDAAPVLDVNCNPANPVIGLRSFSDDPETVARLGVAYMNELQKAGVVATLKHFPGHGDTDTDSHTGLPAVNRSLDELKARELIPFQACIDAGAEAIMTAHIEYPQIETETVISKATGESIHLPATLSKTILTDLLRGEMGFEGVIITDAMNMDAVASHFDPLDAAKLAIAAGVDILLMPVDLSTTEGMQALDDYIGALTEAVEKGEIKETDVDAAVLRILKLKEAHGLLEPYSGAVGDVSSVGSAAHHAL